MPSRSAKPCGHPGCRALVRDGTNRCPPHTVKWAKHDGAPERMRGRPLQRARARLFKINPLCVACEAQGFVTLATQRDHVVSLGQGGKDEEENTQGLCEACHRIKSEAERLEGLIGEFSGS